MLFTSVFSAISILWDREFGFLKEILVSPVPRTSVAIGKIVGGATQAMMQGVISVLMLFPFMFGFSVESLGKIVALIPLALLLAVGMTSIGVAIAANMKSMEGFPMIMNLFLMPMFFLSGAMFPLQGLPGWMTVLTKINPLSYGVDMLRGIALKGVSITGATSSIISKIPPNPRADAPTGKSRGREGLSEGTVQTQRYPLWLDSWWCRASAL